MGEGEGGTHVGGSRWKPPPLIIALRSSSLDSGEEADPKLADVKVDEEPLAVGHE